jgi:hypothetical protein
MLDDRRQLLEEIWDDCDFDLRSDLAVLAEDVNGISLSDLSDTRRRALEQRGLGTISGNRIRASCRLMAKFALQQAPAIANLKRLFGTRDVFDANIRGLLEYRLAQVLEGRIDQIFAAILRVLCAILSRIRRRRSGGYASSLIVPWR